jgi:hypothetical protein
MKELLVMVVWSLRQVSYLKNTGLKFYWDKQYPSNPLDLEDIDTVLRLMVKRSLITIINGYIKPTKEGLAEIASDLAEFEAKEKQAKYDAWYEKALSDPTALSIGKSERSTDLKNLIKSFQKPGFLPPIYDSRMVIDLLTLGILHRKNGAYGISNNPDVIEYVKKTFFDGEDISIQPLANNEPVKSEPLTDGNILKRECHFLIGKVLLNGATTKQDIFSSIDDSVKGLEDADRNRLQYALRDLQALKIVIDGQRNGTLDLSPYARFLF